MLQPFGIVSFWEIAAVVCAAAFLPLHSRENNYFGGFQHISEFQCLFEFVIEFSLPVC